MPTPPLKIAVLGKGGSGKTVLVTLLARALAARGLMVLAVDLDSNPGLAVSLGLPPTDAPLPDDAVEEQAGLPYGWGLARHLTAAEAVRRYALPAGERVFFLGFGNNAGLSDTVTRHLTAVRQVVDDFNEEGWAVIADLSSGPTDAFEGYARFASLALIACDPTATSTLTAGRLAALLDHDGTRHEVIGTKARDALDEEVLRGRAGAWEVVPFDPDVWRLEKEGSLATLPARSPALLAAERLAGRLTTRELSLVPDGASIHVLSEQKRRSPR